MESELQFPLTVMSLDLENGELALLMAINEEFRSIVLSCDKQNISNNLKTRFVKTVAKGADPFFQLLRSERGKGQEK